MDSGDDNAGGSGSGSGGVVSHPMYSPSASSSGSGSGSADDDSKKFQYVFEYDAVHSQSQSQPPSTQTFSPSKEYVPAQLLHEPVGDVREARSGSNERRHIDAFPFGNNGDLNLPPVETSETHVILDSPSSSSESDRDREGRNRQKVTSMRGGQRFAEEMREQSVTLEVLDLSDDSLR
jgi:hypothetical protein